MIRLKCHILYLTITEWYTLKPLTPLKTQLANSATRTILEYIQQIIQFLTPYI